MYLNSDIRNKIGQKANWGLRTEIFIDNDVAKNVFMKVEAFELPLKDEMNLNK